MVLKVLLSLVAFAVASLAFFYGYANRLPEGYCIAMNTASLVASATFLIGMVAFRKHHTLPAIFLAVALASVLVNPYMYAYGLLGYFGLCVVSGLMLAFVCEGGGAEGTHVAVSTIALSSGMVGATYGVMLAYRVTAQPGIALVTAGIQFMFFSSAFAALTSRVACPSTWREIINSLRLAFVPHGSERK